jgi:oligopeptide transport system substrate-binding protein
MPAVSWFHTVFSPPAFLSLIFLLAGCGGEREKADFVWLLGAEPETIDPGTVSGQPGGRVARNLFEGLVYNHPRDLRPVPGMARSWEISEDGRTYTFHLRQTVWSDGTPVTAHDFVYSWERVLNPATAAKYANMLYPVQNAQEYNRGDVTDPAALGLYAPDDSTLIVTLHSPCAYFLDLCCFYTLLPVPRHAVEAFGEDWIRPENMVSNGPFTLDEWLLNQKIVFRRNPLYWDSENVALNLTEAMTSDNINASFNLYMSGILDWVDSGAVPLFVVPELLKRPDFHVAPYLASFFYRFNLTRPPFDDVRVRRAFVLATDNQAITRYVLRAGQIPAHSLVPPGMAGYTEARIPPRNVEEARRLLAEAGYPNGEGFPHVELLFNTSESNKQIVEVLQQQWKDALGVHVELVNQEWKVFLATQRATDYWISRGGWIGDYLDPNTFLDLWTSENGNNRTGFADPAFDALIDRAARTLDPAERMALLHEAEDWVINREVLVIPVYYYVVQNLYDERDFEGLTPNLLNLINLRSVKPLRGHRGRPRETRMEREPVAEEPRTPVARGQRSG